MIRFLLIAYSAPEAENILKSILGGREPMLLEISIKNFAIIEEISLNFEKGMTVLTGETGGKSIIIDAMNMMLEAVQRRMSFDTEPKSENRRALHH